MSCAGQAAQEAVGYHSREASPGLPDIQPPQSQPLSQGRLQGSPLPTACHVPAMPMPPLHHCFPLTSPHAGLKDPLSSRSKVCQTLRSSQVKVQEGSGRPLRPGRGGQGWVQTKPHHLRAMGVPHLWSA